jgi:hypothetical protein
MAVGHALPWTQQQERRLFCLLLVLGLAFHDGLACPVRLTRYRA